MPRQRYQRGTLRTSVPGKGSRPERKLPRGTYWARWYRYIRQPDGTERRQEREKIVTKELAAKYHVGTEYTGPLAKSDAQHVLDLLIAQDSGVYVPPNTEATFEMVAREYIGLAEPGWGAHMVRGAKNLIEKHLIGGLGSRPIASLTELELQQFLNSYVKAGSSSSLLKKLLYHLRAILKHARKKEIITGDPAEDLNAKSRRRICERALSIDECRRLISAFVGRDRLIIRMFVQLGLRPEEMFALRRDDVQGDRVRVDEALVDGQASNVKTDASHSFVHLPPDLASEVRAWLECSDGAPADWLFPRTRGYGRGGPLTANNYRERTLQPGAIRASVGVIDTGERDEDGNPILKTDVTFQALRRTCATLFGDVAKDPKSTQAQLRHADPSITLKHYQKSIPETVKVAAAGLEAQLFNYSAGDLQGSKIEVSAKWLI